MQSHDRDNNIDANRILWEVSREDESKSRRC